MLAVHTIDMADVAVPMYSKNASSTAPPRTQFKLNCSIRQVLDWTYPRPRRTIETRYNLTGVEPSLNNASLQRNRRARKIHISRMQGPS